MSSSVYNRASLLLNSAKKMVSERHDAVNPNHFFPHYQPIIELSSGKVGGYEVLARTRNNDGDTVSAGQLFHSSDFAIHHVMNIDRHIRSSALNYFSNTAKNEDGFVSLNISPHWVDRLSDADVSPTLKMIELSGIDPQRVVIEITEGRGDLKKLKRLVSSYHQHGVKVAIDDFGAGASQVDRIAELEPDLIKLDMGLFKAASKGGVAGDIALSMSSIAQRTGCAIVCEGVEDESEFHFALECGADYIQGWLFHQALPELIDAHSTVDKTAQMKHNYLIRKSTRLQQAAQSNQEVSRKVRKLCEVLRTQTSPMVEPNCIDFEQMAYLGIIRYYLCDSTGTQVSPNFEINKSGIQCNHNFVGHNWSHRPYFPLLIGMRGVTNDHLVVSTPYKDSYNGTMCKTYGIFISPKRTLLIDVLVRDDILFLEA